MLCLFYGRVAGSREEGSGGYELVDCGRCWGTLGVDCSASHRGYWSDAVCESVRSPSALGGDDDGRLIVIVIVTANGRRIGLVSEVNVARGCESASAMTTVSVMFAAVWRSDMRSRRPSLLLRR